MEGNYISDIFPFASKLILNSLHFNKGKLLYVLQRGMLHVLP